MGNGLLPSRAMLAWYANWERQGVGGHGGVAEWGVVERQRGGGDRGFEN